MPTTGAAQAWLPPAAASRLTIGPAAPAAPPSPAPASKPVPATDAPRPDSDLQSRARSNAGNAPYREPTATVLPATGLADMVAREQRSCRRECERRADNFGNILHHSQPARFQKKEKIEELNKITRHLSTLARYLLYSDECLKMLDH